MHWIASLVRRRGVPEGEVRLVGRRVGGVCAGAVQADVLHHQQDVLLGEVGPLRRLLSFIKKDINGNNHERSFSPQVLDGHLRQARAHVLVRRVQRRQRRHHRLQLHRLVVQVSAN